MSEATTTTPKLLLTPRQRAWLDAYYGPAKYNASKAAILAGYSPKHARQSGHQARKSPAVAVAMREREELDRRRRDAELADLRRQRRWG